MNNPIPLKTRVTGEIFTHNTIWAVVHRQLKNATDKAIGSLYDLLPAMVFSALTFEAYLNFVGARLNSALWKERKSLSKKAELIFQLCQIPEPDRSTRPYLTIWKLKELRDQISHGRTVEISETRYHDSNTTPDLTGYNPLDQNITLQQAKEAVEHVEQIIRLIHNAARPLIDDPWFDAAELGHSQGYRSHFIGPP